jgi:hypothetical protein
VAASLLLLRQELALLLLPPLRRSKTVGSMQLSCRGTLLEGTCRNTLSPS